MNLWENKYKCLIILHLIIFSWFVQATPSYPENFQHNKKSLNSINKWFILLDYNPEKYFPRADATNQYDMVILDADHYPPHQQFSSQCLRIGYISVGEAEDYRFYWNQISKRPWIISENPNWEGNYYVDVRSAEWHSLLLNHVIPKIVANGFQGLFIDTLDTVDVLEEELGNKFSGSKVSMIALIEKIRQRYPELLLISNGGFSILKQIAPYLDGILVEDIYMMVDFKNDSYMKVSKSDRKYKINKIKEALTINPLPVFNIEYISENNHKLIKKYIHKSKKLGFKPYIAEKNLNKIYKN